MYRAYLERRCDRESHVTLAPPPGVSHHVPDVAIYLRAVQGRRNTAPIALTALAHCLALDSLIVCSFMVI